MTKRVKRLDTIDRMSPPPRETFYAHTTDGPQDEWEPLYQHLEQVAIGANGFLGARQFAEAFGCGQWGELAGFWHDLGKYSSEFQQRIGAGEDPESLEINHRVDHSTAGAKHAVEINDAGYLLAYAIAGHTAKRGSKFGIVPRSSRKPSRKGRLRLTTRVRR